MPSGYYADVVNTSAANSFTRVQTFTPNAADIGSVSTVLNNGDFETGDLTGWIDDSTGWSVSSGNLIHATGQEGLLQQDVTVNTFYVYYAKIVVSGANAGYAEIFNNYDLDIITSGNGTFEGMTRATDSSADSFYIYVTADFDGQIEAVEYALVVDNVYPAALALNDLSGNPVGSITGAQDAVVIQSGTGITLQAQRINLDKNVLPSSYDTSFPSNVYRWNGFLFLGDPANIPASDPGPGGGPWNDGGTLKIA